MQGVMEMIRAIRNLRAEMNVPQGKRTRLMIIPENGWAQTLESAGQYFIRLAGASQVELTNREKINEKTVSAVCRAGELFIPLGDLVDIEKEIARLQKECLNLQNEITRAQGKLNNPGFINKAPAQLVAQEQKKLQDHEKMLLSLQNRLEELKGRA